MADPRTIKALEHLQPAIERETETVLKEVSRLIADNELTPERALAKCHELSALRCLPKKLMRSSQKSRPHNT